jgi:hypothetical protein
MIMKLVLWVLFIVNITPAIALATTSGNTTAMTFNFVAVAAILLAAVTYQKYSGTSFIVSVLACALSILAILILVAGTGVIMPVILVVVVIVALVVLLAILRHLAQPAAMRLIDRLEAKKNISD